MSAFLAGPSRRTAQSSDVVTYRHLLSPQAMTVFNPLRTIAHCDIDAAYAQFESVRLGIPDDVPLICAQWQSIIAVNYPARKFGIKRFTTIDEAKRMCPHLYVQHVATYRNGESEAGYWGEVDPATHKVSLDPYRRESLKILAIFKEMVPKGEIEKASIDEAFLDLSLMVIDRLLAVHPYLAEPPADAPEGLDSPLPRPPPIDWTKAGNVFPINGETEEGQGGEETEAGEGEGEGHVFSSQKSDDGRDQDRPSDGAASGGRHLDRGVTWEDWALCVGAEIMAEIRGEVWKRLHYTCSAGIAHSKAMAKLCSAWKKPNNQTILRKSATPAFLRNMDFTDIRYLGGKLGNAIATEYGAKTVGDMLMVPLEEMQTRFGEESIWVYNILRGIDHTEVKERTATKSMLASKNTRPAVMTPEQGMHWIGVLAGELNVRLRDARELNPGLWPKTLVLGHRTGIEAGRSRQIPFPFTRNLSTEYIVKYAKKMWDEVCQPMRNGSSMKLNNMSLSFTGLERLEGGQQGIEGFFGGNALPVPKAAPASGTDSPKRPRTRSPSPMIKPKPSTGESAFMASPKKPRLSTLHSGPARKTVLETFLSGKRGESSTQARTPTPGPADVVEIIDEDDGVDASDAAHANEGEVTAWKCPKCGFRLDPVDEEEADHAGSGARRLAEIRQEHEDFHFAQDLQQAGSSPVQPKRPAQALAAQGGTTKKRKKKEEGIKAFFAPKPFKKE